MYTVLCLLPERRVPLFDGHVWRLGESSRGPLGAFARTGAPGVYRVWWRDGALSWEQRGPSRLVEGMPTRVLVSPFAGRSGRLAKPPVPGPYDAVRAPGVATLLTDAHGRELYEACSAALVAWDGNGVVLPPLEVPAVASLAEAAVAAAMPHRRDVLPVDSPWPLLLVNALGTFAVEVPGRPSFPGEIRQRIQVLI